MNKEVIFKQFVSYTIIIYIGKNENSTFVKLITLNLKKKMVKNYNC